MTYPYRAHYDEDAMAGDPEIEAMSAVTEALSPLDEEAQARVLEWASKRYGVTLPQKGSGTRRQVDTDEDVGGERDDADHMEAEVQAFDDFADLYDAADPQNDEDRALVGAYWWQVLQEEGAFTGYRVNESLRNMGHEADNITRSLGRLQKSQPALVRQMAKSGKSKQARKTYKLTNAGIKAAEAMIE
jgi:hypothetical protein